MATSVRPRCSHQEKNWLQAGRMSGACADLRMLAVNAAVVAAAVISEATAEQKY